MGDCFIVVGAGVFGSSTALELVKAGHSVTVLERSLDGYHSIDAASNDLNKIIRADYADEHYRQLAKVAISAWRRSPLLSSLYHEVGLFFHAGKEGAKESSSGDYVREGVSRAIGGTAGSTSTSELPRRGEPLPSQAFAVTTPDHLLCSFPTSMQTKVGHWSEQVEAGTLQSYCNPRGGWAEADRATRVVLDEARRLGARVYGKSHVVELLFDSGTRPSKVVGVKTSEGKEYHTTGNGHAILCAGAWANGLLQDLLPKELQPNQMPTWPSAQCVVTLQLNEEQRRAYAGMPVIFQYSSGFYCFEPDSEGVMKIAIHSNGYRHPTPSKSTNPPESFPSLTSGEEEQSEESDTTEATSRTSSSRSERYIPKDKLADMLSQLFAVFPDLADAPVKDTRVCFYSDSQDENWIIDHLPNLQGLVVASGDSGHGFKFLPILGSLVCARLGLPSVASLTQHQRTVFSFEHHRRLLSPHDATGAAPLRVEKLRSRL